MSTEQPAERMSAERRGFIEKFVEKWCSVFLQGLFKEILRELDAVEADKNTALLHLAQALAERHSIRTERDAAIADRDALAERAAFGDQCYQDRCENAYVEQSVVKQLEADFKKRSDEWDQIRDSLCEKYFSILPAQSQMEPNNTPRMMQANVKLIRALGGSFVSMHATEHPYSNLCKVYPACKPVEPAPAIPSSLSHEEVIQRASGITERILAERDRIAEEEAAMDSEWGGDNEVAIPGVDNAPNHHRLMMFNGQRIDQPAHSYRESCCGLKNGRSTCVPLAQFVTGKAPAPSVDNAPDVMPGDCEGITGCGDDLLSASFVNAAREFIEAQESLDNAPRCPRCEGKGWVYNRLYPGPGKFLCPTCIGKAPASEPVKPPRPEDEPYFIEICDSGCSKCGGNRFWDVIGPDGSARGTSWGIEEQAQEVADYMNEAFCIGRDSVRELPPPVPLTDEVLKPPTALCAKGKHDICDGVTGTNQICGCNCHAPLVALVRAEYRKLAGYQEEKP